MKPLLMVVPLHPVRKQRAKKWLETSANKEIADIIYVDAKPSGAPVYGMGGELYSAGGVSRALFEEMVEAHQRDNGEHKFFGICADDVVVHEPKDILVQWVEFLEKTDHTGVGITEPALDNGDFKDGLIRLWIVVNHCLLDLTWDELWNTYHFPDFEPAWHRYSNIDGFVWQDIIWSHWRPTTNDMSRHDLGWVIEKFHGRKKIESNTSNARSPHST